METIKQLCAMLKKHLDWRVYQDAADGFVPAEGVPGPSIIKYEDGQDGKVKIALQKGELGWKQVLQDWAFCFADSK